MATNFTDIHSIVPSMLIKAGANAILLGLLTAIMVGGSGFMQIVFASTISNQASKKKPLLIGISLRIIALLGLGLLLGYSNSLDKNLFILLVFILISVFSFSGSYASISYVDIVGKSIFKEKRKHFSLLKEL